MKRVNYYHFRAVLLTVFLMIPSFLQANAQQRDIDSCGKKVVAVVFGEPVYYSDIQISNDTAAASFEMRNLSNSEIQKKLPKVKHKIELSRLTSLIYKLVRRRLLKDHNIRVNDEEIAAEAAKSDSDFASTVRELRRSNSLLLKAVNLVLEGRSEVEVYNELLQKETTLEVWLANLRFYKTPKGRAFLTKLSRVSIQEEKAAWYRAVNASLQDNKLSRSIDVDISKKIPKFAAELALAESNGSPNKEPSPRILQARLYVSRYRANWWSSLYRRFIVVKDKEFSDVYYSA